VRDRIAGGEMGEKWVVPDLSDVTSFLERFESGPESPATPIRLIGPSGLSTFMKRT
jgi:hypothetical protein